MAGSVPVVTGEAVQVLADATQFAFDQGNRAKSSADGLPAQVAAGLAPIAPAVAAAQKATSDAFQLSNLAGAVTTEGELAGKVAGQYRVGTQYVTWNGNAVTARTDQLASKLITDSITYGLQVAAVSSLVSRPRTTDEVRRLADGDLWEYRATGTPDGSASRFGTVQAHSEGGYWHRIFRAYSLSFFGAVPVQGNEGPTDPNPPVDSYAAFALAAAALPYGATLIGDDSNTGVYYLSQTWELRRDDIVLDINNQIAPMPNMSDKLVSAPFTQESERRFGAYNGGNPWQASFRVRRLIINGKRRAKGFYMQGRDLFNVAGLMVRYTKGYALHADACREGVWHDFQAYACDATAGGDKAVLQLLDTGVGADANNTLRFMNPHITHCNGHQIYIGTPKVGGDGVADANGNARGNGSQARLIYFDGYQIETIGSSQVGLAFGDMATPPIIDTTLDAVVIENGDDIVFSERGHIGIDTLTLPATGGITRGGSAIRLGFDSDTRPLWNNPKRVTNFVYRGKMFVGNAQPGTALVARHNCDEVTLDPTILNTDQTDLQWVNGASGGDWHRNRGAHRMWNNALVPTVILEAKPGQAATPAVEYRVGGKRSRTFAFAGQMVHQPDVDVDLYYWMTPAGFWVAGGSATLGLLTNPWALLAMTPLNAAPTGVAGASAWANGTAWNPGGSNGGKGYPVTHDGTDWRGLWAPPVLPAFFAGNVDFPAVPAGQRVSFTITPPSLSHIAAQAIITVNPLAQPPGTVVTGSCEAIGTVTLYITNNTAAAMAPATWAVRIGAFSI